MTRNEADWQARRIRAALQTLGVDVDITMVPPEGTRGWCVEVLIFDRTDAMKLAAELESASVVP